MNTLYINSSYLRCHTLLIIYFNKCGSDSVKDKINVQFTSKSNKSEKIPKKERKLSRNVDATNIDYCLYSHVALLKK